MGLGVAVKPGALVHLHINARFESRRWGRARTRFGRMNRRRRLLRLLLFGRREWRIQFLDLTNLAACEHYYRAGFNAGGVIEIHPVRDQRPKQSRRAEQDQKKGDHADRADHEQARQDFISF